MTEDWWENRKTMPRLESNPNYIPDCHQCIWVRQKQCMVCGNPNQTEKDKTEYLYVGFNCPLFEYPKTPSKEIYML